MGQVRAGSEPVFGVQVLDLEVFRDERGELVAIEEAADLPFKLRRIFYMRIGHPGGERINHAASSDLFVTPVIGSVVVGVDNGDERASLKLDSPRRGIWTRPGIHLRFSEFARSTVLLVCASQHLFETRFFSAPQPHLIDTRMLA